MRARGLSSSSSSSYTTPTTLLYYPLGWWGGEETGRGTACSARIVPRAALSDGGPCCIERHTRTESLRMYSVTSSPSQPHAARARDCARALCAATISLTRPLCQPLCRDTPGDSVRFRDRCCDLWRVNHEGVGPPGRDTRDEYRGAEREGLGGQRCPIEHTPHTKRKKRLTRDTSPTATPCAHPWAMRRIQAPPSPRMSAMNRAAPLLGWARRRNEQRFHTGGSGHALVTRAGAVDLS